MQSRQEETWRSVGHEHSSLSFPPMSVCVVFQKLLVIWISKVKRRGWERGRGREREREKRERDPHHTSSLTLWVSPFYFAASHHFPLCADPHLYLLPNRLISSGPNSNLKLRNWWSGRGRVSLDRRAAVSNRVALKKIARGGQKQTGTSGDRRRSEKERKTASGDRVAMEVHGMRD